jgi:hypothetical protein
MGPFILGEMLMARTKYSEHFCGYCNRDARMEFVGLMEGVAGKAWYRCTRCHHTSLLEADDVTAQKNAQLDPSVATPYKPCQCFSIGEAIFHREWNDVGKVLAKTKTSDGSQAILVSFSKLGQRRLIENFKQEEVLEPTPTQQ